MKKELKEDLQFTGLFTVALAMIIGGVVLLADLMTSQMAMNNTSMQIAQASISAQAFDKKQEQKIKQLQQGHKSVA